MLSKKIILAVPATSAAIMIGLISVKSVSAATTPVSGQYPTIVQKLVDKFGLNASDVQAVFNANRQEHQADRQKAYVAMLDTAVKDGKLTEAQKQLVLTKHNELVAQQTADWQNRKTHMSMTQAQRDAQKVKREELKKWATENGIDVKYLMFMGGRGHGFGQPPPTSN